VPESERPRTAEDGPILATHQVGYRIVTTLDRLSRRPEDATDIDEALSDALVAIVVAADHTSHTPH
jgi:DNA invertase Pin-like site-specific DNA recombinase